MKRRSHLAFCFALVVGLGTTIAFVAPGSAATSSPLKTATTSDKTASIGLPAGWALKKGSNGFVYATGPNDERINLGVIVVAKNAASGAPTSGEVAFALPFSASLQDKLTTIIQTGAAKQGMPTPQITYASTTRTKLPMCSLLLGGLTAGAQARKFEAVICSLRPDAVGLYKNLVFLAQVPASRAAQDRAIVAQIVQSYRVTPDMFKKMIAPYTPLPPRPPGGYSPSMPGFAPYEDPTNSDCFDYNIIRESPPWEMPMHCGGWQPG